MKLSRKLQIGMLYQSVTNIHFCYIHVINFQCWENEIMRVLECLSIVILNDLKAKYVDTSKISFVNKENWWKQTKIKQCYNENHYCVY